MFGFCQIFSRAFESAAFSIIVVFFVMCQIIVGRYCSDVSLCVMFGFFSIRAWFALGIVESYSFLCVLGISLLFWGA